MKRTSPEALTIARLQTEIEQRNRKITQHKEKIHKLKRLIKEICQMHEIAEPDLRFDHYMPSVRSEASRETELEEELSQVRDPELGDRLLSELIINQNKMRRRHSQDMKRFCGILFMISPSAYKTLSEVLPVQHSDTVMRFLKPRVKQCCQAIESLDGARETLRQFKARFSPHERILCTISVDACSHESHLVEKEPISFSKRLQIEEFLERFGCPLNCSSNDEVHKYCFVFHLEPLDSMLPCTALYMCTEKSGKAYKKHVEILHVLRSIAVEEGFTVVALCSDGDSEYYNEQRESFHILQEFWDEANTLEGLSVMGQCILQGGTLFCSDMLHILKNARTRLLSPGVSVNVRYPKSLQLEKMIEVLNLPRECFRNSPLNKMMDSLPLMIFTFENARKLFHECLFEEAMFVLTFALFQAFFRAKCGFVTRVALGLIFLRTVSRYMSYLKDTTANGTLRCLEFHRKGAFVCMFPTLHLERMAVTVATPLSLCLSLRDGTEISLNRCSTHPLENFFGQLRRFCHFKHSYTNIRDKVGRTQTIKHLKDELGLESRIRTRVSVAGERVCVTKAGTGLVDVDYSLGIMSVIDAYYAQTTLGLAPSLDVCRAVRLFIEELCTIELPSAKVQGSYSGLQIMNRLIANSRE